MKVRIPAIVGLGVGLGAALAVAGCGDVKQRLDRADSRLQTLFGTASPPAPRTEAVAQAPAPPIPQARPTPPADPLRLAAADWDAGRFDRALSRLRPLAEGGDAEAQYRIGLAHAQGRGVERDGVAALAWWHRAAVQGHPAAQFQVAEAYLDGRGVEEDAGLAAEWLARAAARDHAPATWRLAMLYDAEARTTNDEARRRAAVVLVERAAAQGHAEAQLRIGEAYADGRDGLEPDAAWAARWFGKAARQGVSAAQGRLGDAFASGRGVPRDVVTAAAWYAAAARSGHDGAAQALAALERSLSPEQREEAGRLAAVLPGQPSGGYEDPPSVLFVQTALADRGLDPGAPDGLMGPATRAALLDWQKSQGLEPDGRIGPRVLAALRGQGEPTLQAEVPVGN